MTNYWESTAPGEGRRRPRADAVSDARILSLNGTWRFRLSPTVAGTGDAFVADDFDDSAWDAMPVPSHWVLEEFTPLAGGPARSMLGTAEGPLYTNTAYPIPLDAPRVSTENPTGDYRVAFDVPDAWAGGVLRFQGVDSCAKVWLNGHELGWSMGSRLPFEFDAPVRPGRNVLAVRVHRWSAGTYLEDQDMWWLPGIFRDVELIERPAQSIDDHFVHADYDHETGVGMLRVEASTSGIVEIPELGIRLATGETATVPVEPWSAQSPRLYRGTLRSPGETIELAVGFRRVAIVDGVFTVNGRALTFRGVNRHEHHPDTGRTLDRDTMIRDIVMMKRANIDSVRTSHYPPHPEFLRLCDDYGIWVVVENDLETHGFIYAGWEGNPPAEAVWRDALHDRMQRTVERDKNHPSVVVWSMANESMTGDAFEEMRRWIEERDPSRAVLYERDPSYKDSDFYSLMYPSLELLEQIGRREEPRGGRLGMHGMVVGDATAPLPDGVTEADEERRRGLPFLLVEYAHAMGNGPGSLQDYWRIIRAHDRLCGAFVWEWIDHGFHAVTADGTAHVLHGDDLDYEPRGGRFSLHGLVFSDRTPTPGLVSLAKAHEPVLVEIGDAVEISNIRHCADTADLAWRWRVEVEGHEIAAGALEVPVVAAGSSVSVMLPDSPDAGGAGEVVLTVEAVLAHDELWADAGHVVAWGQGVVVERALPAVPSAPTQAGAPASSGAVAVGPARFDAASGRLVSLGALELDGPWIDVHRAPTENDHGQGSLNDLASLWTATGIDRMLPRTDRVERGEGWLRVEGRTAPTTHPHGIAWSMLWQADGEGVVLTTAVDFTGPWRDTPYMHRDILLPRLGLLFSLPAGFDEVQWYGRGPGETYVDSFEASPLGRFSSSIDGLQTPYPVPQENGNHVQTRTLAVSGEGMPQLRVDGMPVFDFTARRWTSHDLQRAAKPYELGDSGRVWLNIDHAQQGLGSASVGPALPEQYRVPREHTAWSVRLAAD
ncbi:glycoside hydrolase family 2 TIM barrel-domain containing protein [Microbacterium sp. NPDC058021]|uniref:glycoside hydrolase family 2 TIM barrel-domain containing protein n=1 Tax=Microbacterium sp. NPDC058021 TaxID=3346306 RepID=UPI0036DB3E37